MRLLKKKSVICTFLILLIGAIASFTYYLYSVNKDNLNQQVSEGELISSIIDYKCDLFKVVDEAESLDINESQVSDKSSVSDLNNQISSSKKLLNKGIVDTPRETGIALLKEKNSLVKNIKQNNELLSSLKSEIVDLNEAIDSIKTSKLSKDISNNKTVLIDLLSKANKKLSSSEGNVADESTRGSLSDEISVVDELVKSNDISYEYLSNITEHIQTLQAKIDDVDKSIQRQQEIIAEKEQRASEARYESQQAAQEAAQSGGTAVQADDGTWYVDYSVNHRTYDLGAGLTEWEDGYYVAHSNTNSGQNISGKPGSVVVDGISYHYVSSIIVSPGTTWQEVEDYVHANNGIGFQTCNSDGTYLITHYEPD